MNNADEGNLLDEPAIEQLFDVHDGSLDSDHHDVQTSGNHAGCVDGHRL